MAEYRLGFDEAETLELEFMGRLLTPVVKEVLRRPDGSAVPVQFIPPPQAEELGFDALARWAETESARLLLTSAVERRRFQSWEREVLLTAGMPRRLSNTTARQSAEAWEVMGEVMDPDELPGFVMMLGSAEPQEQRSRPRLRQWWGRLREAITDAGSDDGQRTLGGFVSGLCNMAMRPTQYDESAASTIASAVISAPTCLRALRELAQTDRHDFRVDPEARASRSQVLDAWAACISAVITTSADIT